MSPRLEYKIISDSGSRQSALHRVALSVNENLEKGWRLQGGVSVGVNPNSNESTIAQAMVRETLLDTRD
jgi:hypothetical protein